MAETPRTPRPPATPVTEITAEVLDYYMGRDWRKKRHTHLTFKSADFKLEALDGLFELPIDLTYLETLDASHNALKNLHCVEGSSKAPVYQGVARMEHLQVLKARHNNLSAFEAAPPTLQVLDLSHNELVKIPKLSSMEKLEILVLGHNHMKGKWEPLRELTQLRKLDLSDNLFDFTPAGFRDELSHLKYHLVSLRIKHNPFSDQFPEYQSYILQRFSNLQRLDDIAGSQMTDAYKEASAHFLGEVTLDINEKHLDHRKKPGQGVGSDERTDEHKVPSFAEVADPLNDVMEDPSVIGKTVRQIVRYADAIYRADQEKVKDLDQALWQDVWDQDRNGGGGQELDADKKMAMIQNFLNNFLVVLGRIENNDSWRLMMLRALAKLGLVQESGIGERCIDVLGMLLGKGAHAEEEVLQIVKEIIIEPLQRQYTADKPHIIKSLTRFKSSRLPEALAPIAAWLAKQYCLADTHTVNDVTHLLAVATLDEQNTTAALSFDLSEIGMTASGCKSLPDVLVMSLENKRLYQDEVLRERFIDHLLIIQNLASNKEVSQQVCEVFEQKQLHRDLMKHLKVFYGDPVPTNETKANGGDANHKWKNIDLKMKKNLDLRTCAALLDALRSLMERREILQAVMDTRALSMTAPILEYLVIAPTHQQVADPVLLASSLNGLWVILRNYSLENTVIRSELMKVIIEHLDHMKVMLEFIDGSRQRYRSLWAAAEKHIIDKVEGVGALLPDPNQAPLFTNLRNPLVHTCFEAIVQLMTFFTAEAKSDKQCAEVSQIMNKNERELLLLRLLEVPNDSVKDRVMGCIHEVDISELDADEVGYLVRLLKGNPAGGSLFAKVIVQLRTLVDDKREGGAGFTLRNEYGAESINNVMAVLVRSARTENYGDARTVKEMYQLSKTCVSYLQSASKLRGLTQFMRDRKSQQSLVSVLKSEDRRHKLGDPDIEAECTWTGRSVECLLECFSGVDRVKVSGRIAYRVVSRIADVLEGHPDQPNVDSLFRTRERIHREARMWDDYATTIATSKMDDLEKADTPTQQYVFGCFNGLDQIVQFLMGMLEEKETRFRAKTAEQRGIANGVAFFKSVMEASSVASTSFLSKQRSPLAHRGDAGRTGDTGPRSDAKPPLINFVDGYPDRFQGQVTQAGGAMSIFFRATWGDPLGDGCILDLCGTSDAQGPLDSIKILSNDSHLVFQVYRNSDKREARAEGVIQPGIPDAFLCTVNDKGVMKIIHKGKTVAANEHGLKAPRVRRTLHIGKNNTDSDQFPGEITELRLWSGSVEDWYAIMDEEGAEEKKAKEGPGRTLLMGVLLDAAHTEEGTVVEKPPVHVVPNFPDEPEDARIVAEEYSSDNVSVSYTVAAALRCCYALLEPTRTCRPDPNMQAYIVKSLHDSLLVSKVLTLVGFCGPLDCNVAAKFMRVMSLALELSPTQTAEDKQSIIIYHIVANYIKSVCPMAVRTLKHIEVEKANRGRALCVEILTLASVICRTVPFCADGKDTRKQFTERCLEQFLPVQVIRSFLEMVVFDPLMRKGVNQTTDLMAQGQVSELCTKVVSLILENCPKNQYDVLETLNTANIALAGPFVTILLAGWAHSKEQANLEQQLRTGAAPTQVCSVLDPKAINTPLGVEKIMLSAHVDLFIDGIMQTPYDEGHATPYFNCVVAEKAFYIVDMSYRNPILHDHRHYYDMTRVVEGHPPQVLYVGWAVADGYADTLQETFFTILCRSQGDRDKLLGKLYARSKAPDGNRVPKQLDTRFREVLEAVELQQFYLMCFVRTSNGLEFAWLSREHGGQITTCTVDFALWRPPEVTDEGDKADSAGADGDAAAKNDDPDVNEPTSAGGTDAKAAGSGIMQKRELARQKQDQEILRLGKHTDAGLDSEFFRPPLRTILIKLLKEIKVYLRSEDRNFTTMVLKLEKEKQPRELQFFEYETCDAWRRTIISLAGPAGKWERRANNKDPTCEAFYKTR